MLDTLLRWLEVPIRILLWAGILAGALMMLHVVADVTGRYFFNHPLVGTTEIVSGWYMVAVAFLPWAHIALKDNHIVADLFMRQASDAVVFWNELGVKCLTVVFCAMFTWQTGVSAIRQTRAGEVYQAGSAFIPIWPSRWLLPIAGATMALFLVLRIAAAWRDGSFGPRREEMAE